MHINQCIASKPGLFENKKIDLDNCLTIIHGRNNSGKSLLARAMLEVIWELINEKPLLEKQIWENLYLEITLTNSRSRFQFTRSGDNYYTIKMLQGTSETEIFNRNQWRDSKESREKILAELTARNGDELAGLFYDRDFRSILTLSFLPAPIDIHRDGTLNYESVKYLFLDDQSGFYALSREMKGVFNRDNISKQSNDIFSTILRSEHEAREFEKKIQIIDIQNSKYDKLKREKEIIEHQIEENRQELEQLRDRKNTLTKILNNLKESEELRNQIETIANAIQSENRKREEVHKLQKEIEESFPQFRNFSETKRQNLKKIHRCYREIRDINDTIEICSTAIQSKRRKLKNLVISIFLSSAIAILLSINDLFIKLSKKEQHIFIIGLLALSLLSTLILTLIHLLSRKSKELEKHREDKKNIENTLKRILEENNISFDDFRLESLYEFLLQYFEEFSEYTEKQLELFKLKDEFIDGTQLRSLKKELAELESSQAALQKSIHADMQSIDMSTTERDQTTVNNTILSINRNIQILKETVKNKENILEQITDEIQQHNDTSEEKRHLLEKRNTINSKLNEIQMHTDSMNYILSICSEAIAKREKKQLEKLIKTALDKFNIITNNQHRSTIDQDHIRGILQNQNAGEQVNPSLTHLLVLAIKIALTDFLIDLDIPFPLIIDDPFIYMDDVRTETLRTLLNDISRFRQIIIFTHNNTLKDWGRYIEL